MNKKVTPKSTSESFFILAVCLIVFGCGLLLAGFIVCPTGEIHDSLLWVYGEICTLAGSILGINLASRKKVEKIRDELYEMLAKPKENNEDGNDITD